MSMNYLEFKEHYKNAIRSFDHLIPRELLSSRKDQDKYRKEVIRQAIQEHRLTKDLKKQKMQRLKISNLISDKEFGIRGMVSFMYNGEEVFMHFVDMETHRNNIVMFQDGVEITKPKNILELFYIYEKSTNVHFKYLS